MDKETKKEVQIDGKPVTAEAKLISIAVICFPVFLYLLDYMPLIPVTILSASGVYISRVLLYWLQHGNIRYFFRPYLPEFFFYLIYGCLLYVYTRAVKSGWSVVRLLPSLVLIDYFSNLTELLLRVGTEALVLHTQLIRDSCSGSCKICSCRRNHYNI